MQEELQRKTVAFTVQATKITGKVLKAAALAFLRHRRKKHNEIYVGNNSMKRLTRRDGGANTIDVGGRIKSFEKVAQKYQVRYHIEKVRGSQPPKWTIFFKANQADAITAALKEYARREIKRDERPSLHEQLNKLREKVKEQRDKVKDKEHGGPEW